MIDPEADADFTSDTKIDDQLRSSAAWNDHSSQPKVHGWGWKVSASVAPVTDLAGATRRTSTKQHLESSLSASFSEAGIDGAWRAEMKGRSHSMGAGMRSKSATDLWKNRAREMQKHGCVIDPRRSPFMGKWDLVMVIALGFTALVTPVEVGFLQEGLYITPLFVINRIIDAIFMVDIVLTFHLGYQAPLEQGGHWVLNKRTITVRYLGLDHQPFVLSGWFWIDFVSVLPFWVISLDYSHPFGDSSACLEKMAARRGANITQALCDDLSNTNVLRSTVLFRVVKLLRMLKLARVLKASKVLERHLLDVVTNQWEWTFAVLNLVRLTILLSVYAHWQACFWGLAASYMDSTTWLTQFEADHYAEFSSKPEPLEKW